MNRDDLNLKRALRASKKLAAASAAAAAAAAAPPPPPPFPAGDDDDEDFGAPFAPMGGDDDDDDETLAGPATPAAAPAAQAHGAAAGHPPQRRGRGRPAGTGTITLAPGTVRDAWWSCTQEKFGLASVANKYRFAAVARAQEQGQLKVQRCQYCVAKGFQDCMSYNGERCGHCQWDRVSVGAGCP